MMYPQMQRLNFASSNDGQHFTQHQAQFHANHQSSPVVSEQSSTLNPAQLRHSIGPSRVLTRRQARAAQQQASQLGIDLHGNHASAHTSPAFFNGEVRLSLINSLESLAELFQNYSFFAFSAKLHHVWLARPVIS